MTTSHATTAPPMWTRRDLITIAVTLVAGAAAAALHFGNGNAVAGFLLSAAALAALASLVGRSVEALGDRLGAKATGLLQTALGNLPELFVILFALKAGLFDVVKATLVGSILANALLVLGAAIVVGGLKHGRQRFAADDSRTLGLMFTLAVFILAVPSLTAALHTPAASHERTVSIVVSIIMLALFALSLPATMLRSEKHNPIAANRNRPPPRARQRCMVNGPWRWPSGCSPPPVPGRVRLGLVRRGAAARDGRRRHQPGLRRSGDRGHRG